MGHKLIIIVWFCLQQSLTFAQIPLKSLNIGDQVPDITISNLINFPTQNLKISNFKGKLLILDFWDTWCSSCIHFLPQTNTLNKMFLDRAYVLPVTAQKRESIEKFLLGSAFLKPYKITSVVADKELTSLFPHNQIPHEVWIDPQGRLIALTTDEYVTAGNIEQVLNGQHPQLAFKKDELNYDWRTPLFFSEAKIKLNRKALLYTTGFTGCLEGVAPAQHVQTDTLNQTKRFSFINQPVLNLYALIYNSGLPFTPTRRILRVADPGVFVYSAKSGYYDKWLKEHTYTYEAIVPFDFSRNEVLEQMQFNMERVLKIKGCIQQLEIECWILHRKNNEIKLQTAYTKKEIQLNAKQPLAMHRITAADLISLLDERENAIPVIDESGTPVPFDLNLRTLPVTLKEWNLALQPIGLEFLFQKRKLDMFILSQ
ncbi:MAG: thiol-disulfide isomerase-like thioredoxin [Chitinophagaceae bacterium]|nr:thiol-disulfide isomerase-like thioredoxin [Chitinophagaceae bacterium]